MDITTFLAQFWGWFLIVVCLPLLLRKNAIDEIYLLIKDRGFALISGYVALIVGLVSVLLHNLWVTDWRLIITILGWLSLIKGIVRIGSPQLYQKSAYWFENKQILLKVLLVIMIILGVWMVLMSYRF